LQHNLVDDCWHACWTCPHLNNSEDEGIKESAKLKDELTIDRISFYNGAIITEDYMELGEQYDPLAAYTLSITPQNSSITNLQPSKLWPCVYYFGEGLWWELC